MSTIQFTTVIGADGVIHPPAGMTLPSGTVDVTVRPEAAKNGEASANGKDDSETLTFDWLIALAEEAAEASANLPSDMAEQHDYYAHGKPKS